MAAADLLYRLRHEGFELAVDGDRLRVRLQSGLTEGLRAAIRQHKGELLAVLKAEAEHRGRRDRLEIRWARERGWLMVWDPQAQTWHEVPAHECPEHWRFLAQRARGRTSDGRPDEGDGQAEGGSWR